MQPHFKGMFEGIKKLEMHKPGSEGRRHFGSTAMFSPDGEYLPFNAEVQTDGRPEDWLNKVRRCRLTISKAVLKPPMISALQTIM